MQQTEATTQVDLVRINSQLSEASAEDRLRWAAEFWGPRLVLLSSFQKTASVLMHLMYQLSMKQEILFVDTGFHFHETLRLRDELMRRFNLNIVTLYPAETPFQQEERFGRKLHLYIDGQPVCCRLRKEEPFLTYVRDQGKKAILSGLRRDEGERRGAIEPVLRDPRIGGYVVHPLSDWSNQMIDDYLREHDVPVHPLHAQSYPSIGCACCTTPVREGESPRAGRWRHLRAEGDQSAMYCGINFTDGSGI